MMLRSVVCLCLFLWSGRVLSLHRPGHSLISRSSAVLRPLLRQTIQLRASLIPDVAHDVARRASKAREANAAAAKIGDMVSPLSTEIWKEMWRMAKRSKFPFLVQFTSFCAALPQVVQNAFAACAPGELFLWLFFKFTFRKAFRIIHNIQGKSKTKSEIEWSILYTIGILCHVEWCIRQLWSASIISAI